MCKVVSELPFAHTCDKIEPKEHDPQTINLVLVDIFDNSQCRHSISLFQESW